jgi:hypothetical protein
MGFRDRDHKSLHGKIFAIGDSFTMGIGQPYEHTWPSILEDMMKETVVKLAADGAGNDWMREVFNRITDLKPKAVFVMLSFLHREMIYDGGSLIHLHYDEREIDQPGWSKKMLQRTMENLDSMNSLAVEHGFPVFFTAVPEFDCVQRSEELREKMIHYPRLNSVAPSRVFQRFDDLARDGFHFGKKTCENIAKNLYSNYRERKK